MSFSELERVIATAKALLGNVLDSDPVTQWYESTRAFAFVLDSAKVWTQGALLRANPAPDIATARANVLGPLAGVVLDLSDPLVAVRLTPVPGVNNTYIALATYGDLTSQWLDNWLKPTFIPRPNGLPSNGYAVRLYNGNPATGGVEVLTTDGTTGTGINKSVGWIWNYDNGMLLLANDFAVADPWVLGFRYIGQTAGGGGGVSDLDGGRANEVYGGVGGSPLDGGNASSF